MKKIFHTFLIVTAFSLTVFQSCKKDDGTSTTTESKAPTLKVNNGLASKTASSNVDTISLDIVASADTDRKIKKLTITRAIAGQQTVTIKNSVPDVKDLVYIHDDIIKADPNIILDDGAVITYSVTVEDDKGKSTVGNFVVNIKTVATSPQILLGGPSATTNEYKFFGVSDDFKRYRAGSTGIYLAKDNSSKIDFVFFFSAAGNVQNALYSPDYPFAFGEGWYAETQNWTVKNKTMFTTTTMTSSQFDALQGQSFNSEIMNVEVVTNNWTTGVVNKMANLTISQVLAFKKADGKRGFIKVANPATNASGQILLIAKAEL